MPKKFKPQAYDERVGVDEDNVMMMMIVVMLVKLMKVMMVIMKMVIMKMVKVMRVMMVIMKMVMPGDVDDGSSVSCSATYRGKRPRDAVRARH